MPCSAVAQREAEAENEMAPLTEEQGGTSAEDSSYTDTYPGKLLPFGGMLGGGCRVGLVAICCAGVGLFQGRSRSTSYWLKRMTCAGATIVDTSPGCWALLLRLRIRLPRSI